MKKRNQVKAPPARGFQMAHSARTGDHCPANGWWVPLDDEGNGRFLTEGSIMPSVNGATSSWKLVMSNHHQPQVPRHDLSPREFAFDRGQKT